MSIITVGFSKLINQFGVFPSCFLTYVNKPHLHRHQPWLILIYYCLLYRLWYAGVCVFTVLWWRFWISLYLSNNFILVENPHAKRHRINFHLIYILIFSYENPGAKRHRRMRQIFKCKNMNQKHANCEIHRVHKIEP